MFKLIKLMRIEWVAWFGDFRFWVSPMKNLHVLDELECVLMLMMTLDHIYLHDIEFF